MRLEGCLELPHIEQPVEAATLRRKFDFAIELLAQTMNKIIESHRGFVSVAIKYVNIEYFFIDGVIFNCAQVAQERMLSGGDSY
jgi:hypothetical protein